jgi:predicted dehydrogenase
LELPLDGVVIATPSGLHARQCVQAFERGHAVFCQKPLARTAAEVEGVIAAARRADRLLGVDFSYRESAALLAARQLIASGELGRVYALDFVFHNAYGPASGWANDPELAGGGCLIDLGVHLLDTAFWLLGPTELGHASSRLYARGQLLPKPAREVEDFAVAEVVTSDGVTVRVACSWRSSFGADAQIRFGCFGTEGGVTVENVAGSFYDFACDRARGSKRERLVSPPDAWGGRAILSWLDQLSRSRGFREDAGLLPVARALDSLYGHVARSGESSPGELSDLR